MQQYRATRLSPQDSKDFVDELYTVTSLDAWLLEFRPPNTASLPQTVVHVAL